MSDGIGCTCFASYQGECACNADWTPQEVYELRDKVAYYSKLALENSLAHSEKMAEITDLKQQRDELLAAAKMSLELIETNAHERRHVRWKLKDAIEKVESEK